MDGKGEGTWRGIVRHAARRRSSDQRFRLKYATGANFLAIPLSDPTLLVQESTSF